MMLTSNIDIEVEDVHPRVVELIDAHDVNRAVELIVNQELLVTQMDILSRLAFDLDLDLSFSHTSERLLALASDLNRALDRTREPVLARALILALDLSLALALARLRDLALARAVDRELRRAVDCAEVIYAVLQQLAGSAAPERPSQQVSGSSNPFEHKVVFQLIGIDVLTPRNLIRQVGPYLQALVDLQQIISQAKCVSTPLPQITLVSQNLPLCVGMTNIREGIEVAKNIKQTLGLIDKGSHTPHVTLKKLGKKNPEASLKEKQKKIEFALSLIQRFAPNLSETERVAYVIQIMKPINALINSPLEVLTDGK